MNYIYNLFDLNLSVPFPCPMLAPAPADAVIDVTVTEGEVIRSLEAPIVEAQNWQAAPGRFLVRGGRRSGRFLVENGQQVTLFRNKEAEEERLCAHLLSSVIVAVLRQRGQLVLHASVVLTPRGAIALSGTSGAGKSTTQAALLAQGCQMVADDITVLRLERDGRIMVLPGVPNMSLCEDAATKLGHDIKKMQRSVLRSIKVIVPLDKQCIVTGPVPLNEIWLLKRHYGNDIKLKWLKGAEKFVGQQECFYGPLFPVEHPRVFPFIQSLADRVEMVQLERPVRGCSVNRVAEAILHG